PGGRATFPGLTVLENLRVGGLRMSAAQRKSRVDVVLEQFQVLRERGSQLAGTMSGGQQQMLALARALMTSPRVLMIDELSLGLAPAVVSEVLAAVVGLRDQ